MTIPYPHFWVNFKIYPGTSAEEGLEIARTIERVQAETGVDFVVSPQLPDLRLVAEGTDLSILAQYADGVEPGRGMGRILLETLANTGADGVSINHAERRETLTGIASKIHRCRKLGIDSTVSVFDREMGRAVAQLDPDCLVFEKPKDISTDRAITQTHPERVEAFVEMVNEVNAQTKVFAGGGISSEDDVRLAFEQGADAVGAASAVIGADDRYAVLSELASGFP